MNVRKYLFLLFLNALLALSLGERSLASSPASESPQSRGGYEKVVSVPLGKMIQEVSKRNASAINDYLQAQISGERIRGEQGIFEPVAQASYTKLRNHVPNSTEDIISRGSMRSDYIENADEVNVGINGLVPTGANWELKFVDRQRNSSVIEDYRKYAYEYSDSIRFSLTQPVLKGFGTTVTKAKIELAKIQKEVDDHKFNQKMMELIGVTVQYYWKLYGAQKIRDSWESSLQIAESVMSDIELRFKSGKVAKTEWLEAQSSIGIRKSELYNAESKVTEAQNQLLTLLNVSVSENAGIRLTATDEPFDRPWAVLTSEEYIKMALDHWPEYKIAKKNVEKEKIQLAYAENQVLPQLDLIGTVGFNSLDENRRDSLREVVTDKYVSWSVGVKLSRPLWDNARADSDRSIARLRTRQAELEINAVEKSLSNTVHSKVDALKSLQEQWKEYEKGLNARTQLLEIERMKLKAGRASLKELLAQEEEYVSYQRKALNCLVNYKLAEAMLDIASGHILQKYDVDKKWVQYKDQASNNDLEKIFGEK
jgi:outer membrane protein TolC